MTATKVLDLARPVPTFGGRHRSKRRHRGPVAEVTIAYSKFRLPSPSSHPLGARPPEPGLSQQALGRSQVEPASDDGTSIDHAWRIPERQRESVLRLCRDGKSLTSISKDVGIAWDSVARLLDEAGIRARSSRAS